jgi:endonuclease YncB( thermonuclease family)
VKSRRRSAGSPAWPLRTLRAAYLAAALALALGHGGAAGAELTGSPVIIDGATLEVGGQRIRLFGIAAPAVDQICQHGGRDYACGKVARAALWDLVAGLEVSCTSEAAPESDGRIPASCTAGEVSLNESMVRSGWAFADRRATDRYVTTETGAKEARRGLWKGNFVPPWEWHATPAPTEPAPAAGGSPR